MEVSKQDRLARIEKSRKDLQEYKCRLAETGQFINEIYAVQTRMGKSGQKEKDSKVEEILERAQQEHNYRKITYNEQLAEHEELLELDKRIDECEEQYKVAERERKGQEQRLIEQLGQKGFRQLQDSLQQEQQAREREHQQQRGSHDIYELKTPPAVLIIYSSFDRDGSEREKNDLVRTLQQFNVNPIIKKDLTRTQILSSVRAIQTDHNLSGMMVIIMSHGQRGAVTTADGLLNINEILLQMNVPSLDRKPKILVVQACQSAGTPTGTQNSQGGHMALDALTNFDARPASAAVSDRVDLRHADFMLMMATVNGGTAYRNLMIPKLCKHLNDLEPHEDMYMAFLRTHREILNAVPDQVAEFRSTLRKQVILKRTRIRSTSA